MSIIFTRILPALLLVFFHLGIAAAQQRDRSLIINLGDAVVTGFSGTIARDPAKKLPANKSAVDFTFINPDGASARIVDLSKPDHVWDGRLFAAPKTFDVLAKDVGQVFGVALDDAAQANIYVAATSVFGLNIVGRGRDGLPERRKKGGPGTGWMKGQFGLDLQGGPGAIFKIDGRTGAVTLFANVTLHGVPNPASGLGNLAYDSAHKQLFVSDLYTGMIHRFDLDGRELGVYDHGVTGLTAAKLAAVAFNPRNRPNIASDRFDAQKPDTWGFAPAARRVWGLAVHDGRLYYSVVSGPQIWSVGIGRDGSFADDPRWELDVPAQAGPLPVSDIAFSHQGAMILAQRALIAGAYDYSAFTRPGEPKVFRVWLKGPNDPPSPGRWKLTLEEYAVGFAGNYRNTNGGVALGYGYGRDGALSANACEFTLWTTGQNLRNKPALKSELEPGGPLVVHGLAGVPASPVRDFNEPPWTSYAVDYNDAYRDPRAAGHVGSVRIYSRPCPAPAVYSGPGYAANPPYVFVGGGSDPICVGPNCGRDRPIDVKVEKTGDTSPPPDVPWYSFTLTVTNVLNPFNGNNIITVSDVVPPGMTFTGVTATPASDWSCPVMPPAVPAGGTVTCTYIGSGPTAPNQLLGKIKFIAMATGPGPYPPFTNCAAIGIKPGSGFQDGNPSNDKACVTVPKPKSEFDLGIAKIGEVNLANPNGPFNFTIGVRNLGALIAGPTTLTLTDVVPAGMTFTNITSSNWNCIPFPGPPIPAGGPLTCTYTGSFPIATNQALGWITIVATGGNGPYTNCANLGQPDADPSNDKACATVQKDYGNLIVAKEVINKTDPKVSTSGLVFPVTVTCGSTVTPLNLIDGLPQTVSGIPYNTNCSAVEATPPMPTGACPAGVLTWTTAYLPPGPVTVVSGTTASIKVRNTLECKPGGGPLGTLKVTKTVVNKTQGTLSTAGLSYPISVSCASGGSPAVVTTFNLAENGSQTVNNIALNSSCTVTETSTPAPTGVCGTAGTVPTWSTLMIPSSPVPVNGTNVSVTVQNTLECKPSGGQLGTLKVTKTIVNNTGEPNPTTSFPVTVTCVPASGPAVITNASLAGGGSTTVSNIALGSTCTVNEPTPPDAGLCVAGAAWTVSYTGQNPVLIGSSPAIVGVTNTLNCKTGGPSGSLLLRKSLSNYTDGSLVGVMYPATVSCVSGMSPATTSNLNLIHNNAQTVNNLVLGSVCTVSETLPTPPNGSCPAGQTATWSAPVYTPPTATISGTISVIEVHNTLNCVPNKAKLVPLKCAAPLVANSTGQACVCPAGRVRRGKSCVKPVVCKEPARLNSRGTACFCPRGMTRKGNSCVEPKRKRERVREHEGPRVTPGDVLQVLPGLIGPGGFGGDRPRGGGGTAPKGGGDRSPGRP